MIVFAFQIALSSRWERHRGWLSLGFVHFRLGPLIQPQPARSEAEVKEITDRRQQKRISLDSTKRKSLQPSAVRVPVVETLPMQERLRQQAEDEKKEKMKHRVQVAAPVTVPQPVKPLEKTFTHKFYGGQLVVGGIVVARHLNRQHHVLEIIGNTLYIDNVVQKINPGEMERIKDLIRQSRA